MLKPTNEVVQYCVLCSDRNRQCFHCDIYLLNIKLTKKKDNNTLKRFSCGHLPVIILYQFTTFFYTCTVFPPFSRTCLLFITNFDKRKLFIYFKIEDRKIYVC